MKGTIEVKQKGSKIKTIIFKYKASGTNPVDNHPTGPDQENERHFWSLFFHTYIRTFCKI